MGKENQPLRILHYTSGLYSGGVQRVLLSYAEHIQKYGVIFDYLVERDGLPEIENHCRDMGSRIYKISSLRTNPVSYTNEIKGVLEEGKYKVFHSHHNHLNCWPLRTAQKCGVKVRISHAHANRSTTNPFKKTARHILSLGIQNSATECWACSQAAYLWLYEYPYNPNNTHAWIMHNAVDLQHFQYDPKARAQVRSEWGIQDEFVCICVATLSPRKNQTFLLDVCKILHEQNAPVRIVFAGDGSIRAELQHKAEALGVENAVMFLGDCQDVPRLLNGADCLLLPSTNEGLPLTTIEGVSNGLKCLLSDAITREVGISQQVEFLPIGAQNAERWAKRISLLVAQRPLRERNAAELVRAAGYDLECESCRLAQKYRELSEQ